MHLSAGGVRVIDVMFASHHSVGLVICAGEIRRKSQSPSAISAYRTHHRSTGLHFNQTEDLSDFSSQISQLVVYSVGGVCIVREVDCLYPEEGQANSPFGNFRRLCTRFASNESVH